MGTTESIVTLVFVIYQIHFGGLQVTDELQHPYMGRVMESCQSAPHKAKIDACWTSGLHMAMFSDPAKFCTSLDKLFNAKKCVYEIAEKCVASGNSYMLQHHYNWADGAIFFCNTSIDYKLDCLRNESPYTSCVESAEKRVNSLRTVSLLSDVCSYYSELKTCYEKPYKECPSRKSNLQVDFLKLNAPLVCPISTAKDFKQFSEAELQTGMQHNWKHYPRRPGRSEMDSNNTHEDEGGVGGPASTPLCLLVPLGLVAVLFL